MKRNLLISIVFLSIAFNRSTAQSVISTGSSSLATVDSSTRIAIRIPDIKKTIIATDYQEKENSDLVCASFTPVITVNSEDEGYILNGHDGHWVDVPGTLVDFDGPGTGNHDNKPQNSVTCSKSQEVCFQKWKNAHMNGFAIFNDTSVVSFTSISTQEYEDGGKDVKIDDGQDVPPSITKNLLPVIVTKIVNGVMNSEIHNGSVYTFQCFPDPQPCFKISYPSH